MAVAVAMAVAILFACHVNVNNHLDEPLFWNTLELI